MRVRWQVRRHCCRVMWVFSSQNAMQSSMVLPPPPMDPVRAGPPALVPTLGLVGVIGEAVVGAALFGVASDPVPVAPGIGAVGDVVLPIDPVGDPGAPGDDMLGVGRLSGRMTLGDVVPGTVPGTAGGADGARGVAPVEPDAPPLPPVV